MSQQPQQQPPQVDPVTAFWRDVMARAGVPAPTMPQMPAAPAGMSFVPTPDMVRKMQSAWYDAMSEYAEQYMRSPQFLESMKKSMDQAVQMRQQVEEFMRTSMASSMKTAGVGGTTEILAAIKQSESAIRTELESLAERVSRLEKAAGVAEDRSSRGKSAPGKPSAK